MRHLRRIGLERVHRLGPSAAPIVYAEWLKRPGAPTVLVYGHYDVQPADARAAWSVSPFAGVVRDGYVYGRGASDNKGQLFCHLAAIESYLKGSGRLPVNIKILIDSEEETGSPTLQALIPRMRVPLRADVALMSDTRMLGPRKPVITYGLRGGLGIELIVRGPACDLHNGHFGGAVHNPAEALSRMLASLHDRLGRVVIPGFYSDVREPSSAARQRANAAGLTDQQILAGAGVRTGFGESGYSTYERIALRPAAVVQRMHAGGQGAGRLSVIPATASAQIRFRLVPDQTPGQIEERVRGHLQRVTPATVRLLIKTFLRTQPVVFDLHHPAFAAAAAACRKAFGSPPVFLRSGGSIPVVATIREHLGIPVVLLGFALAEDNAHGPNERFALSRLQRGIHASIAFMDEIGRQRGGGIRPWWGRREKANLGFGNGDGRGRRLQRV